MAALTDISDIINRFTGGNSGTPEHIFFFKSQKLSTGGSITTVGNRITNYWRGDGQPGGAPLAPSTATACTNATNGALKQTSPSGGRQKWLVAANVGASIQNGMVILYDRLLHISGLSGTSITAQTVGGTLGRYNSNSTCIGNRIYAEINTAIGSTGRTITASYTNQAGSSGQTTVSTTIGGTGWSEVNRVIPIPLAVGDTGVQAVASVTLSASTGTAGDFGIVIARPIMAFPQTGSQAGSYKDQISGIPGPIEIASDACLALYWQPNSASSGCSMFGSLHFIEK